MIKQKASYNKSLLCGRPELMLLLKLVTLYDDFRRCSTLEQVLFLKCNLIFVIFLQLSEEDSPTATPTIGNN